jgi:hypothetical protein
LQPRISKVGRKKLALVTNDLLTVTKSLKGGKTIRPAMYMYVHVGQELQGCISFATERQDIF